MSQLKRSSLFKSQCPHKNYPYGTPPYMQCILAANHDGDCVFDTVFGPVTARECQLKVLETLELETLAIMGYNDRGEWQHRVNT